MNAVMEEIRSWPFLLAFGALYIVVFLRAGGTYAIGRLVAAGVIGDRGSRSRFDRALDVVHRWGPLAVMLSFLTIGAQTAINAAAGLIRIPWYRYALGLVPGAVLWALVWSTIGMSAFYAVVGGREADRTGLMLLLAAALAVIALATYILRFGGARDRRAQ